MTDFDRDAALQAFCRADFNWTRQLQNIWADPRCDLPALHGGVRRRAIETLDRMASDREGQPLGWIFVGEGGIGKTHLLGAIRREAAARRFGFVLIDMTDVRDFWETVRQGYIDSLQNPYADGLFQYQVLLHDFVRGLSRGGKADRVGGYLARLAGHKTEELSKDVRQVLSALHRYNPKEVQAYQDVVRALICLNSDDFEISSAGYAYLMGQELDDEIGPQLGFQGQAISARDVVAALSWVMSLAGPAIVAFDQLDSIVQQVRHQADESERDSEAEGTAQSIIEQIGGGLAAMYDTTRRTLSIVSCLEGTFHTLRERTIATNFARFEPHFTLERINDGSFYRHLVAARLSPAYEKAGIVPPSPTWPFADAAFERLGHESPRFLLQRCSAHQDFCRRAGKIEEIDRFGKEGRRGTEPSTFPPVDHNLSVRFNNYKREARPAGHLDERKEDQLLAPLYRTALECLVHEVPLPNGYDAVVETNFSGGATTVPLHARLRSVRVKTGREQHFCLRVLQRTHHRAYQARLRAAIVQSGIDKSLPFRHLVVVRATEPPKGKKTASLTTEFERHGGKFHVPTDDELRLLIALHRLSQEKPEGFRDWLKSERPLTSSGLDATLAPGFRPPHEAPDPKVSETNADEPLNGELDNSAHQGARHTVREKAESGSVSEQPRQRGDGKAPRQTPVASEVITFGESLKSIGGGTPYSLPLTALTKHVMILGGSGSGKSVTVRRMVEEAALARIPSVVVDCAQDMCLFDERWSVPPAYWRDGDQKRADLFFNRTEQVVWTPGSLSSGNPLSLLPLPDFTSVRGDEEELHDAVQMAISGLRTVVSQGTSKAAKMSLGILGRSLTYFAKHHPAAGLEGYIDLLSDLPEDARLGIDKEEKFAGDMADRLRVERQSNPLLGHDGTPLDPLVLFGDEAPSGPTRISVISLVKLKGDGQAQSFLNQLAMQLFSWIKANPTPPENRPLRGLLVIDEARDFVPSSKSTVCKESMMRLAAQARKYRLGLVFATQHPKDIETKIVGNCATHLYGFNNSPASLQTLSELMAQKGGSGKEIGKLSAGQFFAHNVDVGQSAPAKIRIPMSLSRSPKNPMQESEIIAKATSSRVQPR